MGELGRADSKRICTMLRRSFAPAAHLAVIFRRGLFPRTLPAKGEHPRRHEMLRVHGPQHTH